MASVDRVWECCLTVRRRNFLAHVALLGAHVPTIVAVGHVATHTLGSVVEFFQECLSAMLRLARHRKLCS